MNAQRPDLDRLEAWLEEGPNSAPNDLLEQILREFPMRQQRRATGWWRTPFRLATYGVTVAAAVVLVLIATRPPAPRIGDIQPTPGWAERFPTQTAALFVRPFEYAIDPATGMTTDGSEPDRTMYQFRIPDSEPITDSTTFTNGVIVRTVGDGLRAEPCQESGGDVVRNPTAQQFVDYLGTVPGLELGQIASTAVGGDAALSVDVRVSASRPCAALWLFEEDCGCAFADEGTEARARRIEALDVDGELILVVAVAEDGDLASWLPTADAFIDTIHFLGDGPQSSP